MDLIKEAKGIKTKGIIGLVLLFTLIGAIVTFIFNIICCIKIMTTDWKNKEIEDNKIIWAVLCIVLLGPISAIIFGYTALKKLNDGSNAALSNSENSQEETL